MNYERPTSQIEALNLLYRLGGDCRVIAGGTDLMVKLRQLNWNAAVNTIVDLTHVEDLNKIREDKGEIIIGSLATHKEVCSNELLQRKAPLLTTAAAAVGSPQIRNRATIGGNIANASAAADTIPPLIALNAVVKLISKDSEREVAIEELFVGREKTIIEPNELLTEVRFPIPEGNWGFEFIKVGRRKALAKSRMTVSVALQANEKDDVIEKIRVVPGAVFPYPRAVKEVDALLTGKHPSEEGIRLAAQRMAEIMVEVSGVRPSTEYKKPVLQSLTERAVKAAWEGRKCLQE